MLDDLQHNEESAIQIKNAGLILFHPFIITYFNKVGLLENSKFRTKMSASRAILLLQWLADGIVNHNNAVEPVLNKILCGTDLIETIPFDFTPTEQEKTVTNELVEIFKNRWPKMKNTSTEAIRSSFIIRDGTLNHCDDGWILSVEQRGYDVLLQTLPWTLNYIKTPIMNKVLHVKWI